MLYEMLAATARQRGSAPAILERTRALDFGQLTTAVDRFAAALTAAGVHRGDAVILLLPNSIEFVVAFFAVAKIGAVVAPLNPLFQEWELRHAFRDCEPRAVVTTTAMAAQCEAVLAESGRRAAIFTSIDAGSNEATPLDDRPSPHAGAVLYQYSSGSTGVSKRVVRTQANLVAEAEHFTQATSLGAADRVLGVVALFHAHGLCNCLLASVRVGAAVLLLDSFVRRPVFEALEHQGVTVFPGVPFMFGILGTSGVLRDGPFPALRLAFSAGAALPRDVFDAFLRKFETPVRQLYGSTETGSVTINLDSTEGDAWSSVGRPMARVEVRIADADGVDVAPGASGEILIRSPAVTSGYAGADEVNARSFRDGWFWSGDLGRRDAAGNLFVTGRKKLFIDTGGYKVDPFEVEAVLEMHPKVTECVVVGVKSAQQRELVKAVVVASDECSAEELQAWCSGKIADFKLPRLFEFRSEIPKSPLGKVLRKYLQEAP